MNHYGTPGVGGSLGKCAICGECFGVEIMLGKSVKSFKQAGSDTTFYGHDKCLAEFDRPGLTLLDLPEASPLRQLYEQQERERQALAQGGI